jgi:glycosyltransferase involved in cell wall biosynthesis
MPGSSEFEPHDTVLHSRQRNVEDRQEADSGHARLQVYMLDLGCIIPYYTGPLSCNLKDQNVDVRLVSIAYHFDPEYFARNHLRPNAGIIDMVGKFGLPSGAIRRVLKAGEYFLNLVVLATRFSYKRPSLIHVQYLPLVEHAAPAERWFLGFVKKLGISLVYTVHDHLPHDTGDRHRQKYARLYAAMDALICHTEQSKDRLVKDFSIDPNRIWVIPHGPLVLTPSGGRVHDAARVKSGLAPSACMVLCQGFIKPYKGLPFLLEAWQKVHASGARARLVIAGTGEPQLLRQLEQQAAALGVQPTVEFNFRFLSAREMDQLHEAADILVFPYKAITMSGALMTGVSYRKPIVATRLPAFEQVLTDGETGILIDYGDVEGLASVLLRLIEDPVERSRLGAATATVEAKYSWTEIAVETRRCYQVTVGGGR